MAVDIAPNARWTRDYGGGAAWTVCGWAKTDRVPASFNVLWFMDNFSYGSWTLISVIEESGSARLTAWQDDSGGPRITGPLLTLGTWYFIALTRSGTNMNMYWRLEGASSLSSGSGTTGGTVALDGMILGNDRDFTTGVAWDGALAYWRVFESALSQASLLSESASATAVATEWADWPLANISNDTDDVSGNSRPLTFTAGSGSQTTVSDPNISLATTVDATMAAVLGGTASITATPEVIATAAGSLGGTAALTSTVEHSAALASALGGAASVTASVEHLAVATAPLGGTAAIAAGVEITAVLAADGGFAASMVASTAGQVSATMDALLGGSTALVAGVEHSASLVGSLGGSVALAATVERAAILQVSLGGTFDMTASVSSGTVNAVFNAPLGGSAVAVATVTGVIPDVIRNGVYTFRSYGTSRIRANEGDLVIVANAYSGGGPLVMFCHDVGDTPYSFESPSSRKDLDLLARTGCVVIIAELGGLNTWGNDAFLASIDQARLYAQSAWEADLNRAALIGEGMGGMGALGYLWRNPTLIDCVSLQIPVVAADALHDRNAAYGALLDAQYGGTAAWEAAKPVRDPSDPANTAAIAAISDKVQAWYSTDDPVVLPSDISIYSAATGVRAIPLGTIGHDTLTAHKFIPAEQQAQWIWSRFS